MNARMTRLDGVLVPCGWEEFGKIYSIVLVTEDDRRFRIDGRRGVGSELARYVGKDVWVEGLRHTGNAISVTNYGFHAERGQRDEGDGRPTSGRRWKKSA